MTLPLILFGKIISKVSRMLNIGNGGTWPGEIALNTNPDLLNQFLSLVKKGIIVVAGTNGKTTTSKMIEKIVSSSGDSKDPQIIHNDSGANLLNGIASAFIQHSGWFGTLNADWAVLEVDENTLPLLISRLTPQITNKKQIIIVLLNLFRDQLDRYGEVDAIAANWDKALSSLNKNATLILNADDPQIAYLGKNKNMQTRYFGINRPGEFLKLKEHATDSTYCRNCGSKLVYQGIYFSHIGIWYCQECGSKRPTLSLSNWDSPLPGLYNSYNTLAAVLTAKELNIPDKKIKSALEDFHPAFGRQEEIEFEGKKVKIFLSKNPAGFNASLRTVLEMKPKVVLFALNDRIPDGRDVSWIWDVDFEMIPEDIKIIVTGDRVYDMALRIKYAIKQFNLPNRQAGLDKMKRLIIEPDLSKSIERGLKKLNTGETLHILPTYSAMLDIRKILKGRKIL